MKRGIGPKKTHLLFLLFMLVILPTFDSIFAQTLDDAIKHYKTGELGEAKRILLNQLAEDPENPEILFYLGKVEVKGELSRRYFQDVTDHCPDWINSDEAELLICQYEFGKGMHVTTVDLTEKFEGRFPLSEMVPEVLWISGCSFLAMDQPDSALLRFEEIIRSFSGSNWVDWAQLARGDCFFADENYNQAIAEYNKILDNRKDSEVFPFALSGLVKCFSQLQDSEKALLYYNLLKERYPNSLESIESPAERMSLKNSRDKIQAERLAGVKYTIQLGVFGIKENALKLRSRFEKQGYSVAIKSKIISGKKYYVVRLGSFTFYDKALELKKKLESQTGESYRIVIR